jgi:hypothetical protein
MSSSHVHALSRSLGRLFVAACVVLALAGSASGAPETKIPPEKVAAFRAMKTVRLVVEQSFPNAPGTRFDLEGPLRGLLESAGLSVVDANAARFDGTVRFSVRGTALSQLYTGPQRRWSGARLEGLLRIRTVAGVVMEETFDVQEKPPRTLHPEAGKTPDHAPFLVTFFGPSQRILRVLAEAFGDQSIVDALLRGVSFGSFARVEYSTAAVGPALVDPVRAGDDAVARRGAEANLKWRDLAWALGRVRAKSGAPYLEQWLQQRHPGPKIGAIAALASYERGRMDNLAALLKDPDPNVRIAAANAVYWSSEPRHGAALVGALSDSSPAVRAEAERLLARAYSDPVAPLIAWMRANPAGRPIAARILEKRTRQRFGEDVDALERWAASR